LHILAVLPPNCQTEDGMGFGLFRPPFAAGGDVGRGRFLVIADHSIFINNMMLQADTGNLAFAYRCAEWLKGDPQAERTQVLYYEEGELRTDFDIPLREVPIPPVTAEDVLPFVNEAIQGLEEENAFNEMLLHYVDQETIWQGLAIAAGILLGLYGFVRLGLFRHRHDPTAPILARALAKHAPVGALLEQRQEELLRDGNLGEAAHLLARQVFESAGLTPAQRDTPPAVEVRGGWWQRRRWRRRVNELWRLACAAAPGRVSPGQLAKLARQVTGLHAALAAGTVRLSPQHGGALKRTTADS
jgi:hypothetical protein